MLSIYLNTFNFYRVKVVGSNRKNIIKPNRTKNYLTDPDLSINPTHLLLPHRHDSSLPSSPTSTATATANNRSRPPPTATGSSDLPSARSSPPVNSFRRCQQARIAPALCLLQNFRIIDCDSPVFQVSCFSGFGVGDRLSVQEGVGGFGGFWKRVSGDSGDVEDLA